MVCSSCSPATTGPVPVSTAHPTARPTLVVYHPGKPLGTIVYSTTFSDLVFGLAWSPDSTRLGVAAVSIAQSWVATTGKGVVNYGLPDRASMASVPAVVWSPDGQYVGVTGEGPGVHVYDARTGVLLKTYPDNAQAATAATTGGYLSASVTLSCGGGGAGANAWSPDGHLMATAFWCTPGQAVQVWNTSTGKLVRTYTGHADVVESLSWSPDGTTIASSDSGSIQVWNALTGQRIYDFEKNTNCTTAAVAWSPEGKTLAYLNCDQVRVVNPFTGQLLTTHTGPHDSLGLFALAWSPDGKSIASAGDHVEVWSVATGRTYYTFTKNASPIERLAWSPDGKYIASANASPPPSEMVLSTMTLQVWRAE
jgi:WD40 repeat protein